MLGCIKNVGYSKYCEMAVSASPFVYIITNNNFIMQTNRAVPP